MASRIKGITVEIGGDVTGLEKALKSVNSTIRTTQSELKDITSSAFFPVWSVSARISGTDRCAIS